MDGYVVLGAAAVITIWMMLTLMGSERQRQVQIAEAAAAAQAAQEAAAKAAADAAQGVRPSIPPLPIPSAPRK